MPVRTLESRPLEFAEPTPQDIERWRREVERDMTAEDRTPVAVMSGPYGLPLALCKDGSTWLLSSVPLDPERGDRRLFSWEEFPPLPGSARDLSGSYWREPNGARAQ